MSELRAENKALEARLRELAAEVEEARRSAGGVPSSATTGGLLTADVKGNRG